MDFSADSKSHGHTVHMRPMPSFSSEKPSFHTTRSRAESVDTYLERTTTRRDTDNVSQIELVNSSKPVNDQIITPAPTSDPRDPLNLPIGRKIAAVFCLCFFGAFAAAAELILGAMLPVFVLEYAGLDPKIIGSLSLSFPPGTNPLALVAMLPGPPISKVYLLGSLPVLMIGLSNLVMIPLATAIGRRPVIIICGVLALAGCVWSGHSKSLDSHLAARCVQAIGAGTVESLIPFVINDLTFSHKRNTWMSLVFAAQGVIIVALGFATPYVIVDLSWRWLYFITAIGAGTFLIGVVVFLPETRYQRSGKELMGIPKDERGCSYATRTWRDDLAFMSGPTQWQLGWQSFKDAMATFFYPQILFITLINSGMIAATFAAGYTAAEPLLVEPWAWPFQKITLCLVPVLLASFGTVLITGRLADVVSNFGARHRPGGKRVPEDQLLNMVLPVLSGIIGCLLFGIAAGNAEKYSWAMFLTGLGLMAFGFLGANTVGAVYVLEVYPGMAGSALLNIASIRYIVAFILSFKISEWIVDWGYLKSFLIYVIPMSITAMFLPPLWYFGPVWKARWPGKTTNY